MTTEKIAEKRKKIAASVKGFSAPDFDKLVEDHPEYKTEYSYTLNYANYMFEAADLKKHTEAWLDKQLTDIPSYEFIGIGQAAWIILHGGHVPEETVNNFKTRVDKLSLKYQKVVDIKPTTEKKSPIVENTNEVLSILEGIVDDALMGVKDVQEPKDVITKSPKFDVVKVLKRFSDVYDALDEEITDEKDKKTLKMVVGHIVAELSELSDSPVKISKKIRTPKKVKPFQLVRKLKFSQEDKETGMKSINPEKIIGADVLFAYNTKTRKLVRFVAETKTGLSVKGTTITGFDAKESTQKTLRKPKETLTSVLTSGKVSQRSLMDSIKAVGNVPTGRINDDYILLKTF